WHPVKVSNITRSFWNPYVFFGLGMSTNSPQAELNGTWVDLRPLQLENNPYNDKIIVFPMGLGFKYKLNVYMDLKVEGNYRFTLTDYMRSEEHTSELQSRENIVCRLLLEKKNKLL